MINKSIAATSMVCLTLTADRGEAVIKYSQIGSMNDGGGGTWICLKSGQTYHVSESIEQVLEKMVEAELNTRDLISQMRIQDNKDWC